MCQDCDRMEWVLELGFVQAEADHVVPRSAGGSDEISNRVLACGPCNRSKGSTPLLEWLLSRVAA